LNSVIQRVGLILIAVTLTTGCSLVIPAPTETSPPTGTEAPSPIRPTATVIPPTNTPAPTPTRTLAPPVETIRDIPYVPGGAPLQALDLYLPSGVEEPFTTVLLFHGGGGSKRDMASLGVSLARQGYAAAALNFRDYPRFTYPAAVEDAFCSLAWLYANSDTYHLDPQRFFSLGHSLGGTQAAMLGVLDDPMPFLTGCPYNLPETDWIRGVITYTGLFDYVNLPSSSDLTIFVNTYLGSTRAEAPELWSQASAITWIDGSEPPFLIVHGEADHTIPIVQSQAFAAALQAAGVQAELLLVPGATHESIISNPLVMEALGAFLATNQETATLPEITSLSLTTLAEMESTSGPVYSLGWSPDGSQLASAGFGQVDLWDGESYTLLSSLAGHTSYVWGVDWAPDGTALASGSQDGSVRIWDPFTATELASLNTFFTFAVAWSPDGSRLASGNIRGIVTVWDAVSGEQLLEMRNRTAAELYSLDWSPDGGTLAAGYMDGDIIFWSATTGARILTIEDYTRLRCEPNGLAWSPDGSRLASANHDGVIRIWNGVDGELLLELRGHAGWTRGVAWSPDGRWLATTGSDGTLQVWDAYSGMRLVRQRLSNLTVWGASWSPDGSRIAVGTGSYADHNTPGMVVIVSVSAGED
jgi:WD40 repeat protein